MGFNLIATSNTQMPAFLQEAGGYQDEGLSAGIQARAPKIGISIDKHFTLTKDGQTIQLMDEMTDSRGNKVAVPRSSINIIIVAASQTLTKAWYENAYVPGAVDAPDCYSNDGKVPAPGVAKPQCANCAQCNKNMFGSNPVTGRGKACADRKMIVCVWDGEPETLMTWNVPTMSLQSLGKFDAELRNANIPMQSVAVELFFDPNVTYPVVKLNALGFADKETTLRLKEASQSAEVMSLLREVDYEPVQPASPVPANTIKFGASPGGADPASGNAGTGSATGTGDVGVQQNAGAAGATAAGAAANSGSTDTPKRTRRTKAQIEAERAAAAAAGNVQTTPLNLTPEPTPAVEEDDEEAAMLAQLEAIRKAKADRLAAANTPTQTQTQVVQETIANAAQTSDPVGNTQVQQETPPGRANVADLLSRWKTS